MINVNSHTGFQELNTCLVGQCYPPEFFSFIKNSKIRKIFERIAIETEEDYEKLINILKLHNVECLRPKFSDDFGMYLYLDEDGKEKYIKPPMQPRDDMIAIGNRLFALHLRYEQGYVDPWDWIFEKINPDQTYDFRTDHQCWTKVAPPCITRVGHDLYFDFYSHDPLYHRKNYFDLLRNKIIPKYFSDYRIHYIDKGGHSDAVFSPIVPGLLVTYEDESLYKNTFPTWEVIKIKRHELHDNDLALRALKKTNGAWWVPSHEFDQELIEFVDKNFRGWTGYAIETFFDVNLLMIDEKNAIINSEHKELLAALEQRGINYYVCPMRHRFFWDCGLHCATLDINRTGKKINYFDK
jgi:hypothetical protein